MKRNVTSKEIIKALKKNGWIQTATVGSHWQFKHPEKSGKVTIPHPRESFPVNTLKSILKQSGLKDF